MTVTEEQRQLASQKREALRTIFRDGLVSLLTGRADSEREALCILARLKELLGAIGEDADAILDEAFAIAEAKTMEEN